MIIQHDRLERDCLADERDWPALSSFFRGHGAATLIAPRWLLTAAHVARAIPTNRGLTVALGGQLRPIAPVALHPDYRAELHRALRPRLALHHVDRVGLRAARRRR